MRKIAAGVLLAIIVAAAAPAYAQTNTELLRTIDDATSGIARDMNAIHRGVNAVLDDIRDLLGEIADLLPVLDGITETLTGMSADMADIGAATAQNTASLAKIERAILGGACGPGTTPVDGICMADIVSCDDEVVDGICMASIRCGEGTLLHVDTCIADVSISYCGEGTVFSGGRCVAAAPPAAPAREPEPDEAPDIGPEEPSPTIVEPAETNRYVLDGDTMRVGAGTDARVYELAFADAPELSEADGRTAALYLNGLCGSGMITVEPETAPTGVPRALIMCGGLDASQIMVQAGHAGFDPADCSIRDFIDVPWTQDRCIAAEEPAGEPGGEPGGEPAEPDATEPAAPATPAAPTTPTQPDPIRGTLELRTHTFPVTVGDVLNWPRASDGDPAITTTISCSYEHTPSSIAAVMDTEPSSIYHIDTSSLNYTSKRHDTTIRLIEPIDRQLFNQKFEVAAGKYVVYDQKVSTLSAGTAKDYRISMSLADWDDVKLGDPPTNEQKAHTIFRISLEVLTDITNMQCTMGGSPVPGGANSYDKLVSLKATKPGSVLHVIPYDVVCRERITITGASSAGSVDFLTGFDDVHIHDNETAGQDDDVETTINRPQKTGLSFVSDNFSIGTTGGSVDLLAVSNPDDISLDGVALVSIEYRATSENVCTWTERTG